MPKCPKCQKEVYFAEKVGGLGQEWHRWCFRCAKCNTTMSSGQETERDKQPYCKKCYNDHFGPKGYRSSGPYAPHSYQVE